MLVGLAPSSIIGKKLESQWHEPAAREQQRRPDEHLTSDKTSSSKHGRRQSHLLEITTVAAMVALLKSGEALGKRGRPSSGRAREIIQDAAQERSEFPVYRNEFDIKKSWKAKGSVAHLCGAFTNMLKRSHETELSDAVFANWAHDLEHYLSDAFEYQDFLMRPDSLPAQSKLRNSLLQLPDLIRP